MNAMSTSFDSMEELIENMNSQDNDLFASSSTESASTAYSLMSSSESSSYDSEGILVPNTMQMRRTRLGCPNRTSQIDYTHSPFKKYIDIGNDNTITEGSWNDIRCINSYMDKIFVRRFGILFTILNLFMKITKMPLIWRCILLQESII